MITDSFGKLEHIFQLQEELNNKTLAKNGCQGQPRFHHIPGVQNPGITMDTIRNNKIAKTEWILQYVRCLQQEIAETVDCLPWKHWSKDREIDEQNLRVEIIDQLHFWVSIALCAGMSAKDVYEIYLKKNQVNHDRQESGTYSKATKTEDDNKAIAVEQKGPFTKEELARFVAWFETFAEYGREPVPVEKQVQDPDNRLLNKIKALLYEDKA